MMRKILKKYTLTIWSEAMPKRSIRKRKAAARKHLLFGNEPVEQDRFRTAQERGLNRSNRKRIAANAQPSVTVSEEAYRIMQQYGRPLWKKGESRHEPKVVELSLQEVRKFRKRLKQLTQYTEGPKGKLEERFAEHLLMILPTPADTVCEWMRVVSSIAMTVEWWDGKLNEWVWDTRRKPVQQRLRQLSREFCGDADCWAVLEKRLDAETE